MLIGFVRLSIRMGYKRVGINGKAYANITYTSESIPASRPAQILKKNGLPTATESRQRPDSLLCCCKNSAGLDVGIEFGGHFN